MQVPCGTSDAPARSSTPPSAMSPVMHVPPGTRWRRRCRHWRSSSSRSACTATRIPKSSRTARKIGRVTYRIVGMPDRDIPEVPEHRKTTCAAVDSAMLRRMIERTLFLICNDETRAPPERRGLRERWLQEPDGVDRWASAPQGRQRPEPDDRAMDTRFTADIRRIFKVPGVLLRVGDRARRRRQRPSRPTRAKRPRRRIGSCGMPVFAADVGAARTHRSLARGRARTAQGGPAVGEEAPRCGLRPSRARCSSPGRGCRPAVCRGRCSRWAEDHRLAICWSSRSIRDSQLPPQSSPPSAMPQSSPPPRLR